MNSAFLYAAMFCNLVGLAAFAHITYDTYLMSKLPSQPQILKAGILSVFNKAEVKSE